MSITPELLDAVRRDLATASGPPTPETIARAIRTHAGVLSDADVLAVMRRLHHDATGAGILEHLLNLDGVTDVVVNGPSQVWFDRGKGLERAAVTFAGEEAVRQLATRLVVAGGGRLDDAQPFANARATRADGSVLRVHAIIPPVAERGCCLSLRVLRQSSLSLAELSARGSLTEEVAELLATMIQRRASFLIVGGTGSGKTTLLSALLAEVSHAERIVCIEDTAELNPPHPHVVGLVSRGDNAEGAGAVTLATLVQQALRMRPDRIVVGEIRGAEIVDLLAALNTGHDGGGGTIHANSLAEVPARIEALAALGGLDRAAAHSQFVAAVRLVLVTQRTPEGTRRVGQVGVVRAENGRAVVDTIWDAEDAENAEEAGLTALTALTRRLRGEGAS